MEPMTGKEAELAYIGGDITADDIIAGLNDGTIQMGPVEPPPDPNSPTWWTDVENYRTVPLFEGWVAIKEPEKLEAVRAAKWRADGYEYEEVEATPFKVDVRDNPDWPGNQ